MPTRGKLTGQLRTFIEKQRLFFVATAGRGGRVKLSPKGMDTLRVVDDVTLRWLNPTGSGAETAAHVAETGRMTLMFCAFEGPAMILRVYGRARVFHPRDDEWEGALAAFPTIAGNRQIFDLAVDLVQASCGTGAPLMDFRESRAETRMTPFYAAMGDEGLKDYWRRKNDGTIDGAPTGILDDV